MNPVPDGCVAVTYKVEFKRGRKGAKQVAPVAPSEPSPAPTLRSVIDPSSIPKITRLLVLGHHLEKIVRDGIVQDYTQLARLTGLSKARITQILNLTMLAPDIQLEILLLAQADIRGNHFYEKSLRNATALADWNQQRAAWNRQRL